MENKKVFNKAEILSKNLTSHGYSKFDEVFPILNKLTNEELEILSYAMYRTAEKSGLDYFTTSEEITEEDCDW